MSKLWSQVLQTSGTQLIAIGASVVSLGITARLLGPSGRGEFAAATTWVGLFAIVGSLSLGQVLVHRVAGRRPEDWLAEMVGTVLTVLAAATVIGWTVAAIVYAGTSGDAFGELPAQTLALAFVALPFLLATEPVRYLLLAIDRLHVANVAQVAGSVVAVLGVAAFVLLLRGGVLGALVAFVVAAAVPVVLGVVHVGRQATRAAVSGRLARDLLGGSAKIHLSTIGTYFFSQANILVLNHHRATSETGYYQLAMQLFAIALVVSNAIAAVSYGLVSREGPDGAWAQQRRLVGQALLLITALAIVGYVAAPLAIRLLAGDAFLPVVPIFRMLLPGLIGATFAAVMASQWVGRGLFWQAGVLTIVVGIASLLTSLALVPRYGAYGAAAGTLFAYGVAVIGNSVMAVRVERRVRRLAAEAA